MELRQLSARAYTRCHGFQALEEEGEQLSAANITTATTTTNAADSNATAVMTTPIPPTLTTRKYNYN